MSGIVGLVEIARSFKLYGEFCSVKGQCEFKDSEEASAVLYAFCKREVLKSLNTEHAEHAEDLKIAPPQNAQVSTETPAPEPEKYPVGEKPTPAPPPQQAKPLSAKELGDALKVHGLTADELMTITRLKFPEHLTAKPFTKDQYVAAFSEALDFLKSYSVESLRDELAKKLAPANQLPTQNNGTDPAVQAAVKEVSAKWPMWSSQLTQIAALWCADHVKDTGALDAFLIAAGVTPDTPFGKIEALLAISRHLAFGSAKVILDLSKSSGKPLSQIESEIDAIVGKPIRTATDIPEGVVSTAFNAVAVQSKKSGGKK